MDNNIYNLKRLRNQFLKSYHNDDFIKAQQKGEQLIEHYKKKNLTDDKGYGNDLFNLGCAYDEGGDYEAAIKLYLKAADEIQKHSGKSLKLSDVYNNMGIVHSELRQNDTALAYFKKCYNIRYTLLEEGNKELVDASYNLGSAFKALHRFTDAAQYYAKALNGRAKRDISYADNLYNLGMCYVETKDFAIGIEYMEKALEIYKTITANPDEYITALGIYAALLYKEEKYDNAVESLKALLELIKVNYGVNQPAYANVLSQLADCYAKQDKLQQAVEVKQKALNIIKKSLGTSHIFYAACLSELGELFLQSGEYAGAAQRYGEALEIRSKILGMDNEECVSYVHTLAGIYSLMQLYNKAEDLLNYTINNLPVSNKAYSDTVLELVKLYMETQDGEGLNRAFEIFNKVHPEKSFDEMLDMAEDL